MSEPSTTENDADRTPPAREPSAREPSAREPAVQVTSAQVPSVRVVVLNWNAADLTSRCIRSIEATEWPPGELDLVLVDNGSIDGSAEVLARRHPGWRVIRNGANLGFAEGINRALRPADADFIALVNNDAVVDRGWLAPLVDTLEAHPEVGAAAPLIVFDRWFVDVEVAVGGEGGRARLTEVSVDGQGRWSQVLAGPGVARPPHWSIPLRRELEVANEGSIAIPVPAGLTDDGDGEGDRQEPAWLELTFESTRPIALRCGASSATGEPIDGVVRLSLPAGGRPGRRVNSLGTALTDHCEGYELRLGDRVDSLAEPEVVPGFTGGGVLLRRAALADVGLFDPRFFMYYEDSDLSWRMRRAGWMTMTAPHSVLHHRLGATAGSSWSGFFFLNYRNWLLTVARNGSSTDARRALGAAWGNSWPFARRNVVGKVRRLQRPDLDITRRWLAVMAGTGASLPRALATRLDDRWRRVGTSSTDAVGSRWLRTSAPSVPRPEVGGPTIVFIDVTDTLVSRWRAGIQRAVSELVTRLALDHLELSLVLMRWSSLDGAYRRLDDAETAAFFDPEAMPNHPPPPPPGRAPRWRRTVTRAAAVPPVRSRIDATRRRTQLRRRPAHHGELIIEEFPAGSIVLDLDASWNLGDIPRRVLYPRLSNAGVTVVSLLHDVLPVTHPDWFDPNLARVFVDHVDAALAHADVVVTRSRFSAGELLRLADDRPRDRRRGPLAIEVIPLGADPVARSPQPVDQGLLDRLAERPVVLVVGTLEPRKNHAGLLDAFESVDADATLVIVGRQGWKADELGERIRTHPGFGDRIVWPAEVNDATLDALYELATVVAVPSHAEGYGLPVVEALRHGCRVVSSTGGSLREIGGELVTYVEATDPNALAVALDEALTDGFDRAADVELPTWDAGASALAEILVRADPRGQG